ncbi:hypothetical protein GHT06_022711 [Daphnia sinensis]|uniref:Uncharacterized protein n=1 Tax=Daphnia sinensis TaxID=1820382 RepID=A0AAD5PLV9_9CRUS|nr:hypothetical protein GHT06_022711 [Daphnia sinensis]
MTYAHRQQVIFALENLKYSTEIPVSACGSELAHTNLLTSFSIRTDDEIIIPASKNDLSLLELLGEKIEMSNWQIEWRIDASEITSISPSDFSASLLRELIAMSLRDFQEFSEGIESVEANLSHLALYRAIEANDDVDYDVEPKRYTSINKAKGTGSFGTLMLQIPVMGGFRGGDFRLKNRKQQSQLFSTSRNSNHAFHMTAFYDDCQILMEPITKGSRIVLVFNLRYKDPTIGIARPLSEDCNSPFYRIWQSSQNGTHAGAIAQLSKNEHKFRDLFSNWRKIDHCRVELYAVPLEHDYCKQNLAFNSLKGIDRSTVNLILTTLGDFVEVHLAIVTKYIGYKEEDWTTSGREHLIRKNQGKSPKYFRENEWVEHWAGNWVDLQNRRLALPPLSIVVPDELLGYDEAVFHCDPPHHGGKFDGHTFDRAAIIMWPRNQTFSTAISFGLDQALDVVENASQESDPPLVLTETKKTQMLYLLALCKKEPNKSWFASSLECSDLRCDRAIPVPLQVASKRAFRLIHLCLVWNLPECGLELLCLLFTRFDTTNYRCHQCSMSNESTAFVGGICSKEVADKLAELVVMLNTWSCSIVSDCFKPLINEKMAFDLNQTGHLADFAASLFHRQCFEAAIYVSDQVYRMLTDFYLIELTEMRSTDSVVGSCINMLVLIDGLPSEYSRLIQLLFQLKSLSIRHPSIVIGWLQQTDVTLLKSIPPYWDFYVDLVTKLESHLMKFDDPTNNYTSSSEALEKAAAQLMVSFINLQDTQKFGILIDRIVNSKNQEARILLAAILASSNIWAVPTSPSMEATLITLSAARVQQLIRFKFPMLKWEQPDAILKEHPAVELFLHSTKESMTYSAFTSEEEAQAFASKYFGDQKTVTGYSAKVSDILRGPDDVISVTISKTPEIYESSLKQLASLEAALSGPSLMTCSPSRNEIGSVVEVPLEASPSVTEPINKSSSTKRSKSRAGKKSPALAPPGKRSKRISIKNQLQQTEQEISLPL